MTDTSSSSYALRRFFTFGPNRLDSHQNHAQEIGGCPTAAASVLLFPSISRSLIGPADASRGGTRHLREILSATNKLSLDSFQSLAHQIKLLCAECVSVDVDKGAQSTLTSPVAHTEFCSTLARVAPYVRGHSPQKTRERT
jgi:hypothetical protein